MIVITKLIMLGIVIVCLVTLAFILLDFVADKVNSTSSKKINRVHFYVARDKDGSLFLHIGKPIRDKTEFYSELYYNHVEFYCRDYSFEVFGLNKNDYVNLKWEDEPVEVFLNMED